MSFPSKNGQCGAFHRSVFSRPSRSNPAAFSLIELLITLALIVVMVVMFWGFSSRSHQTQQKKACQKNLQKIYVALQIFANDHDSAFPATPQATSAEEPLALLVPQYTVDTSSFICPGSKDSSLPSGESFAGRRISYAYWMGWRETDATRPLLSDRLLNTGPKAAGEKVFSTSGKAPGNNHHKYGGNFLFCDGRMESSGPKAAFSLVWTQGVVLLNPKP